MAASLYRSGGSMYETDAEDLRQVQGLTNKLVMVQETEMRDVLITPGWVWWCVWLVGVCRGVWAGAGGTWRPSPRGRERHCAHPAAFPHEPATFAFLPRLASEW